MKITDRLDAVIEQHAAQTSTLDVYDITRWCQQQIRRCRALELKQSNYNHIVTDGTQVVDVK